MIKIKWRFIQFFSYFAKSWPRNGAYVSYFWQIGLTFFMEAQETIIYYLSIGDEKSKLWRLFFIFGSLFAGKWAWPPRVPIMVWDLQTWPKSCHFWRTFSANRYPQNMFSKFSVVNHVLDQKVGFLGEPFGPIAISKSCFRNFQGSTPIPLPPVSILLTTLWFRVMTCGWVMSGGTSILSITQPSLQTPISFGTSPFRRWRKLTCLPWWIKYWRFVRRSFLWRHQLTWLIKYS